MLARCLVIFLLLGGLAHAGPPGNALDAAIDLLRAGRPQDALPLLQGDASAQILVLRGEAYLDLYRFDDALAVEQSLSGLKPGDQVVPMLLFRGRLERARQRSEASQKFLRDAERLATSAEVRLEALDEQLLLHLEREDHEAIDKTLERCGRMAEVSDSYRLGRHLETVGQVQQWQGRRSEAAISYAGARALFQSLRMPSRAARITFLMGSLLAQSGDLDAAWQQSVQAYEAFAEAKDYEMMLRAARAGRAVALALPSRSQAAVDLLARTAAILPPGPWQARARQEWARHLAQSGSSEPERVRTLLEQDLDEMGADDRRNRAEALHLLADHLGHQGQYEEAYRRLDEALALARPTLALDWYRDTNPGPILLTRANILREQHREDDALRTLEQALAAQPERDWQNWRTQVHYQALLATIPTFDLEGARHQFAAGLANLKDLDLAEQRATSLTRLLAALLLNQTLADDLIDPAELALGDYDTLARTLLQDMLAPPGALADSLAIYDDWLAQIRFSRDQMTEPTALVFKAAFLEAVGRLPEARAVGLEAVALARRQKLSYQLMLGSLVLARIENASGRFQAATEALREAAAASGGVSHSSSQLYRLLLASYLRQQGDYAGALTAYQASIDASPARVWRGHFGKAQSLQSLGRREEALRALDQASKTLDGGSRPFSAAAIEALRGRLLLELGQSEAALVPLSAAYHTLLRAGAPPGLDQVAYSYSSALLQQDRKAEALTVCRQALDQMLAWQSSRLETLRPLFERVATLSLETGQVEQALHYLELSKSAELVGSVKLDEVGHTDAPTRGLLRELESLRVRLANLQQQAGQTEQGKKREGIGRVLAATREEFFAKLNQLKVREPDFESLVQLSGSDLSAISAQLDGETALVEYYPAEGTLYLFVVTAKDFRLHEVQIRRADLQKLISHYASLLRDPGSDASILEVASAALHSLLVEPILADLQDYQRLRIVPSGQLWLVPFEELRDGASEPLNEKFEVSLLTSADLLRTLSASEGDSSAWQTLLMGAPDSEELPGAEAELGKLHRLLGKSVVLTGSQATSEALRAKAGEADVLHIASHSGLSQTDLGQSFISLSDGPFTSDQIYGLSLKAGSLVVLSSCQSAVGESDPGRELTSLASAFNIAGASTVVASRWEVDDETTTALMMSFYRHLLQGESRGEALRQARLELARQHPHPYYWAAFSLFGSPF